MKPYADCVFSNIPYFGGIQAAGDHGEQYVTENLFLAVLQHLHQRRVSHLGTDVKIWSWVAVCNLTSDDLKQAWGPGGRGSNMFHNLEGGGGYISFGGGG